MTEPTILPGCSVLPPMEPPRPRTTSNNGKAEKPKRSDKTPATRNRFAVLNAFADFTVRTLDRAALVTRDRLILKHYPKAVW